MALFIAKSPQYRASERVPATISGRWADLRPSTAENQAIQRFGKLLMLRASEIKQERDAAVVGDLYNQWRDADREQITQLLSRKGKEAVDLDLAYNNWYNKSQGKADEQSENGTQQKALKDILSRKREQNLDILARYESQEGQRYKSEQEEAFVDNAVFDAGQDGFNTEAVMEKIAEVRAFRLNANPGISQEALESLNNLDTSKILFRNMQERINQGASSGVLLKEAADTLEMWKDKLGGGYYTLKAKLEQKSDEQQVEAGVVDLEQKFNGDYDKAISFINNKKNYAKYGDLSIAKGIREELRARNADKTIKENKAKVDGLNSEMGKWINARYEENDPILGKAILDNQMGWHDKYAPERKKQMYIANSQTPSDKNDDAAEAKLLETINTEPTKFEYQEYLDYIWSDKFSGVTGGKRQAAQKRLEGLIGISGKKPEWTEKQKTFFGALKTMKKWFGEDEVDSIPIYTEKMTSLQNFFKENPEATDQETQVFFEDLTKGAVERGTFDWLLNFVNFSHEKSKPRYQSFRGSQAAKKEPDKREKAIKYLTDNNKPTTEANIQYVIDNAK